MNDEVEVESDGTDSFKQFAEQKAFQGIIFLMRSRGFDYKMARDVVITGGVELPPIPNTAIGKQIEKIADMLCDGMSGYEIAKKLGFSPAGIRRFCHKHQLDLPERYTVENVRDAVIAYVDEGKDCAEIAELTGFDKSSIAEWCKKNGIHLRDSYHQKVIIAKGKYIMVSVPEHPYADSKGYVRLHRLIAEIKVGRYLKQEEIVHHIDGNTFNEDPANLDITTKSGHAKTHNDQGDIGWSRYHKTH